MTRGETTHGTALRSRRGGRALGVVAMAGVVALLATACTSEPTVVENPSKVLQTVDTTLASDGSITAVSSTAISVDDTTRTSSSATAEHVPADVAGDLPLRISTQYRTADGTGTDLADLDGYDGRVEIELTVENLTVAPRDLSYDVAGTSRTDAALVGAPISLAASTVLTGVSPSQIIADSTGGDSSAGTDGIVSTTKDGDAVVQWAALLAPPRSGASTTLHLVADVTDFATPTIELAAQPGISTDLTVDGVLGSAFDSSTTSELALQQRTIDLVGDVNTVLSRAGETITEVRTNLESTSETLGVRTAEQLKDSSSSLAATMTGLNSQLTSLDSDLTATVTGTESTVLSQLQQTVASVDSLLGDTDAGKPTVTIDGEGCAAIVAEPGQTTSVYGSLLQVSAQLDGYAQSTAGCRDQVAAELQRTVGPTAPDAESCATAPSLTCALFASSLTVTAALIGLVTDGAALADELQPELAQQAIESNDSLTAELAQLDEQVDALAEDASSDEVAQALESLRSTAESVSVGVPTLRDQVDGLHDQAQRARDRIGNVPEPSSVNPFFSETMQGQNARLAFELCQKIETRFTDGLSRDEVERLRSFLTDVPCDVPDDDGGDDGGGDGDGEQPTPTPTATPTPEPTVPPTSQPTTAPTTAPTAGPTPEPTTDPTSDPTTDPTTAPASVGAASRIDAGAQALRPPFPYEFPMSERLANQASEWEALISATDVDRDRLPGGVGDTIATFQTTTDNLDEAIDRLERTIQAGDGGIDSAVAALQERVAVAQGQNATVTERLSSLKDQQDALADQVEEAFADASIDASTEIQGLIGSQVRVVAEQGAATRQTVIDAFDRSIVGLSTTSDVVVGDAKETIEGQRADLDEQTSGLAAAIDEQTASTLERISQSTANSTRDVEGASTLLAGDLAKVMLDLGDREVEGSGILGAMATSAAKADTADFQLALATQNASGYANVRAEDIAGIMLRQAQFTASLEAATALPAFHLDVPSGATSTTLYAFTIGGTR